MKTYLSDSGRLILKGGMVYRNGEFPVCDVVIENGRIASISQCTAMLPGDRVVDVRGLRVIPGMVDVHVHFREPGFSYKETIKTGSQAAARGGFTTVCTMPNLNPAPDCVENLKVQTDIIDRDAVVRVIPYGCITMGQKGDGTTVDFASMKDMVAGFSDDGRGVQRDEVMERAMREVAAAGGLIAAHCEVNELLDGGYIHAGRYAASHGHRGICSRSEWQQVSRDIELAARTGCRYHVCHVSTAESVELVRRAKRRGYDVSCETAPHYLALCEDDLQEDGRFKMNPPLRSERDREALREGVADGTIEIVATDHAPHSVEEKSRGLKGSAMGIVGLETALPVVYTTMVRGGVISFSRMVELMSVAPRRIFGLGGGLAVGEPADVAVVDLKSSYAIDSSTFVSMGHSTPFDGMKVWGRNVMTIVGGTVAFSDGTNEEIIK